MLDAHGSQVVSASEPGKAAPPQALIVPHSVLIVRQMREDQDKIRELLINVSNGDTTLDENGGMVGGMGGGGGFGGGFFSVPNH